MRDDTAEAMSTVDQANTGEPGQYGPTVRVRIDLAYDGTDFSGWARQPGLRTVQETVETTIAQVLRLPAASTVCAGRTDAGVHARGQVIHVDLPSHVSERGLMIATPEALQVRLPRALSDDITVRHICATEADFDARFSALSRRYVYRLWDDRTAVDPLQRVNTAFVTHRLDLDMMGRAAELLLGLHDFAAFCKPKPGGTTVRRLLVCHPARRDNGLIETEVTADAFCHSMVRSIIGALVSVGRGLRDLQWLSSHLGEHQRANDITVMPACGLTLEHVAYPDQSQFAARALQSRSRRDPLDDCECDR